MCFHYAKSELRRPSDPLRTPPFVYRASATAYNAISHKPRSRYRCYNRPLNPFAEAHLAWLPWPLNICPWTWCALLYVGWATFAQILVFLRLFILNLSANNCQTDYVTLRPWPLTLEVTALVGDTVIWVFVLHLCTKFQVRRCSRSEDILSVSAFDLWPWNWCALLHLVWAIFLLILVFLWRFVLDLSANDSQTHHVTLRPWPLSRRLSLMRVFVLCLCKVRRTFRSEDIGHLLCEH